MESEEGVGSSFTFSVPCAAPRIVPVRADHDGDYTAVPSTAPTILQARGSTSGAGHDLNLNGAAADDVVCALNNVASAVQIPPGGGAPLPLPGFQSLVRPASSIDLAYLAALQAASPQKPVGETKSIVTASRQSAARLSIGAQPSKWLTLHCSRMYCTEFEPFQICLMRWCLDSQTDVKTCSCRSPHPGGDAILR